MENVLEKTESSLELLRGREGRLPRSTYYIPPFGTTEWWDFVCDYTEKVADHNAEIEQQRRPL